MTISNRLFRSKGLSIALIAIFALSSITVAIPNASAAGGAAPSTYNINWEKGTPKQNSNWTWTNIDFLYGPSMTMNASLLNGTSVIAPFGSLPTHYLNPGVQFYVNITVPKSLLELGRNISQISFSMNKYQSYFNGTASVDLWSAGIYLTYMNQYQESSGGGKSGGSSGGKPSEPWTFTSYFYNYTEHPMGSPSSGPSTPMPQIAIFKANMSQCRFVETADYYSVRFQGELNCSTLGIKGNFWCYCYASDTKGSSMNARQQYQLVLTEPDPESYGYGGEYLYCSSYVADMTGKETDTVGIDAQFKVVVETQGSPASFKNLSIYLDPPVDYNFWYNSTENSRTLEQSKWITTTGWWYNYSAGEWQITSHDLYGRRETRLMWTTTGISIDEGYLYDSNYTAADWNNYTRPFEINYTGNSYFYQLDKPASDRDLSDGRIAFVVRIPTSANASAGPYYGQLDGYGVHGNRVNGWFASFEILGSNVVAVKLLKDLSDEPILKITPGKYFRAAMEITATPEFRNAIYAHTTNITFTFGSQSVSKSWTIGSRDYYASWWLNFYVTLDTLDHNQTYVQVLNNSYSNWYDRVTYESNYTSSPTVELTWSDYVDIPTTENYSMSYDSSTNILLVALNFTFKPGVPDGYYGWGGDVGNKTYGSSYPYWYTNNYYPDPVLRCQRILPPSTNILVGTAPAYGGYWGTPQTWTVNSKTGALDLDGNNATTYDQFFVKHIYNSTSWWSQNSTQMSVNLNWGQYNLWSYFALMNTSWRYEWSEYYIWYYPNNISQVPMSRFDALINSTVWDTEDNAMKPEYSQIAQYCVNRTWDKIQEEYSAYPWWQPSYTWTWLQISFNQNFFTPTSTGFQGNNLFFNYAGMLLFNDTKLSSVGNGVLNMGFENGSAAAGELTHYFMFENAAGIDLTTPVPDQANGSMSVGVNDSVSWGVSVKNLNGTLYPAMAYGVSGFAGCGYWWHDCYGSYMTSGNFTDVPSKVGIANLNFTAHFSIPNANLTAGALNEVKIKVDEAVGPWTLYNYTQDKLLGYSMALAFVASSSSWQYMSFKTRNGTVVSTDNDSVGSDYYNITSGDVKVANIQMGGANYTWGYDNSEQATHSSTTPMSAFSAMYSSASMSGSGSASICSFSVSGMNYFVTSSFKYWDGYSVSSDPYFAVYTVANPGGPIGPLLILVGCVVIGVVVVLVVVRKRRGHKKEGGSDSKKEKPIELAK